VETIDETGKRLHAKDTRSRSQQLRSLLKKIWMEQNIPGEFEDYYDKEMLRIMSELY